MRVSRGSLVALIAVLAAIGWYVLGTEETTGGDPRDLPLALDDRMEEYRAALMGPQSYTEAVASYDPTYDESSPEVWFRFGDQVRLMLGLCYGTCPMVEVVILRSPDGDDIVLSRLSSGQYDAREARPPYRLARRAGAYAAATLALHDARFVDVPPGDQVMIDAQHWHLSHTLHGQTKDVIFANGVRIIPDDPKAASEVREVNAMRERLAPVVPAIIALVDWTDSERAVLGPMVGAK